MSGAGEPAQARIDGAAFLREGDLPRLMAILNDAGEEVRVVGGAVRNALLGLDVADVDLATTALPQVVVDRATAAGFNPVPTGIKHGSITVVVAGKPFEVTTLRADIETDGRHAVV
ncbi:MAG: CCA tRNA nucleotidyltransferase, partial [Methylobacteriaceae bacterium]|nr:CCA tRNA nucleotidyltransferase [Methylobacteriaceae bacterium]